MKKILPVALVLALALALMIVPAFADSAYSALPDDRGTLIIDQMPPPGQYVVECVWLFESQPIPLRSEPFELSMVSEDGLVALIGSCSFVVPTDDGNEFVLSAELIVGESLPVDWEDPDYLPDAVVLTDSSGAALQFSSLTFIPVPDEPATVEDHIGSIGIFFENALIWLRSIFTELISQPLMLIIWVCIAVCGFSFWGIKKMKES